MKKLLLLAAVSSAIYASSSFADAEDMFYLKANVGGQMLNEQSNNDTKLKVKSGTDYFFGAGFGYYLMDNVRADLSIDHFVDPELKRTGIVPGITGDVTSKHKVKIDTLMVNSYIELFDASVAKVFIGGGIGMAQVTEKVSRLGGAPAHNYDVKAKKSNNLAYAAHIGTATEFAPGVNGELKYSWMDFGKSESVKTPEGRLPLEVGKNAYKGHHISFGIRFDL